MPQSTELAGALELTSSTRHNPKAIRLGAMWQQMRARSSCRLFRSLPAVLLEQENDPAARIVLGHFFFVYIHPYHDGNGQTARFLMNFMMTSCGFPWTVIPVDRRREYMDALKQASAGADITSFAKFIVSLLE